MHALGNTHTGHHGIRRFHGHHQTHGGAGHSHGLRHTGQTGHQPNLSSTYETGTGKFQGGFGVDLDGDGRMTQGSDGVLAYDLNGNGVISKRDIRKSKRRLELLSGTHKDLRSKSSRKRARAKKMRKKLLKKFDRNGDNKVSAAELQAKGARVLVDRNSNGKFENFEQQSLNNIRTDSGSFRLNMLNTKGGRASVTSPGQQASWGRFGQ